VEIVKDHSKSSWIIAENQVVSPQIRSCKEVAALHFLTELHLKIGLQLPSLLVHGVDF
jgi:hypothetical protein